MHRGISLLSLIFSLLYPEWCVKCNSDHTNFYCAVLLYKVQTSKAHFDLDLPSPRLSSPQCAVHSLCFKSTGSFPFWPFQCAILSKSKCCSCYYNSLFLLGKQLYLQNRFKIRTWNEKLMGMWESWLLEVHVESPGVQAEGLLEGWACEGDLKVELLIFLAALTAVLWLSFPFLLLLFVTTLSHHGLEPCSVSKFQTSLPSLRKISPDLVQADLVPVIASGW